MCLTLQVPILHFCESKPLCDPYIHMACQTELSPKTAIHIAFDLFEMNQIVLKVRMMFGVIVMRQCEEKATI